MPRPERGAAAGFGAKLAYRPVALVAGVVGGLIAGALSKRAWALVADEGEPPSAIDRDRSWPAVVTAAALEGAVFAGVKALVERAGASGFARVTGVWPGKTADDRG